MSFLPLRSVAMQARHRLFLPLLFAAAAAQAGPTVDLSAEANLPAPNDLAHAVVYAEANGADPAELARRINQDVAEALRVAKGARGVSVKSGSQNTYPVYGNNRRIETWRMRSELRLESRDVAALSELLGRLQQMRLALASVSQSPAPETRRSVEEAATKEALQAFERRAALIAGALGKPYKIRQLSIQSPGFSVPVPMFKAARGMLAAEAAPAPLEAGESQVTVGVSGQIELLD